MRFTSNAVWRRAPRLVTLLLLPAFAACEIRTGNEGATAPRNPPPPSPYAPPGGATPYGQPPPGQGAPGPGYGAPPAQGQPPVQGQPPAPTPPPTSSPPPTTPTGADPIISADIVWLRARARSIIQSLTNVLPDDRRGRVEGIPFIFDDTPGDVNAFAACVNGKSLMAITDGLLVISARLSEASANDALFGTSKVDEYVAFIAKHQRPGAPIVEVPNGFFDPNHRADARRRARHLDAFDEMVAFVLGHELAHHYLNHLPCTAGKSPLGTGEVARVLSGAVPLFNQPNEVAADVAGTNNVLVAGRSQSGYQWTEAGGLLTMRFFAGVDSLSPVDVLFSFERSHPPPQLRVPIIRQTAGTWRVTGGWLPVMSL